MGLAHRCPTHHRGKRSGTPGGVPPHVLVRAGQDLHGGIRQKLRGEDGRKTLRTFALSMEAEQC